MSKPAYTVILPHRWNSRNTDALMIAIDTLMRYSAHEFKLIVDVAIDEPLYPRINRMIRQADTDSIVYWSSDMFAGPGWDEDMLHYYDSNTIVTNVVVEPGVIGIFPENVQRDFGRKPETFDRLAWETFCREDGPNLGLSEKSWYCPYMISRENFLNLGGLQENLSGDSQGFSGADVAFFDLWKSTGRYIKRARGSFVYHLQRYSVIEEQNKARRD